jgi:hypothetical protein
VFTVVALIALLGMAALVVDLGSWYRGSRASQAAADAAALAGAQALPGDPASATSLAVGYATKNGGGLDANDVSIAGDLSANDEISVRIHRRGQPFFSQLFGIGTVNQNGSATARAELLSSAEYVAPIGVNITQQDLSGGGCPCFNQATTLPLNRLKAPGAFDMINLGSGSAGSSTLAGWIVSGYNGYLPLGGYFSSAGAKWNSNEVQSALSQRVGSVLLFPVYDTVTGTGSNASYRVIAWVGFYLTGIDARGSAGSLSGYFTKVIWQGIQASTPSNFPPDLGAYGVLLVK